MEQTMMVERLSMAQRYFKRGIDAFARSDPNGAIEALGQALTNRAGLDVLDVYTARVVLGQALWDKGFPSPAAEQWEKAAKLCQRQSEAPTYLARKARLAGDWATAFAWACRACADGPSSPDPWWELATAAWWLFEGPVEVGREAVFRITEHVRERPDIARLIAQYEIEPAR